MIIIIIARVCVCVLPGSRLSNSVADSNLVVSLLPASMHLEVANVCIRTAEEGGAAPVLITASYIDEAMEALDERVRACVRVWCFLRFLFLLRFPFLFFLSLSNILLTVSFLSLFFLSFSFSPPPFRRPRPRG